MDAGSFSAQLRGYIADGHVYDSSSSPGAKVYYSDIGRGYFLKKSSAGTLRKEAAMTTYFHDLGMAAEVLYYGVDGASDWMVTPRVPGEDCTSPQYMADPDRLVETLAERLRRLHMSAHAGCPESDRTAGYLAHAAENHRLGHYDQRYFTNDYGDASVEEIYRIVEKHGPGLHADVLLHGDYCLPNIMLKDWIFSGFVDLDCAGVGDRHVDVFWTLWTLRFNLHTDRYRNRFLDAYGSDLIDEDMLRVVAAVEVFG
ncbi:aminoglycoside 3'-phosphotransferase [Bifidobacterium sp.]|jgi:kanamycin kinase|uniref:aminoglycoside 3'-phosphotransferase n=1 Tax=Bifidobacterium sp. TaxID=41200 RepID=UPI0025C5B0DA|nr:aminoglycoside 3'-phosphotransferase [Bifidobacterium sp.]MCH4209441.1 aminoglycoside 3'-phosphotransferase [Bifidobacterium sp.]